MDEELKEVKSVLRALAASSRTKVDLITLQRDYRIMMGSYIPVEKWGYRSVLSFLRNRCSDSFVIHDSSRNPKLTVIVPECMKHLFAQKQEVPSEIEMKEESNVKESTNQHNCVEPDDRQPAELTEVAATKPSDSELDKTSRGCERPRQLPGELLELLRAHERGVRITDLEQLYRFLDERVIFVKEPDGLYLRLDPSAPPLPRLSPPMTPAQSPSPTPHRVTPAQSPSPTPHRVIPPQSPSPTPHRVTPPQSPSPTPHRVTPPQSPSPTPHRVTPPQSPSPTPHSVTPPQSPSPVILPVPQLFPSDCMQLLEAIPRQELSGVNPGAMLAVEVVEVHTPSHFWLTRLGAAHSDALDTLMDDMKQYYTHGEGKSRELARAATLVGQYCAALYEGLWHRALVVKVLSTNAVKVRYVDYGTVSRVSARTLKPLLRRYAGLPAQAVRARLARVRPAAAARRWDHSAALHFISLVDGRHLCANVVAADQKEVVLETLLIDASGETNVCLSAELVRAGYADRRAGSAQGSGESYLLPRWEPLEAGDTLSLEEIHRYLAAGIELDSVQAYSRHVASLLPPRQPELPPHQPELPPHQPELPSHQPGLGPRQAELTLRQPGLTPRQPELPPYQPELPPYQPDLLPCQPGLAPRQPGLAPRQTSLAPRQLELPPGVPGLAPRQPSLAPRQPGLAPRQPGLPPRQPELPPRGPGLAPRQPGLARSLAHAIARREAANYIPRALYVPRAPPPSVAASPPPAAHTLSVPMECQTAAVPEPCALCTWAASFLDPCFKDKYDRLCARSPVSDGNGTHSFITAYIELGFLRLALPPAPLAPAGYDVLPACGSRPHTPHVPRGPDHY